MQVQVVDQTTHPQKCHSFVRLDRQIGSSPPACPNSVEKRSFTSVQMFHTHTHLLRPVIANFVEECILRAATIPLT